MSANPCEEVAVKTRAPVSDADMHMAIAECSDSTLTMIPGNVPWASISESFS